jgi:antitoxin component of MazEF toxin-antitoxin module
MMTQKIRKVGGSLMVVVPREEAEAQGVGEGDTVVVSVRKARVQPELRPDLAPIVEDVIRRYQADLDYLKDR